MIQNGWNIVTFDEIDSTNAEAKRRAAAGTREKTLLVAEKQTAGRGRLGRRWESPKGAGLWMTQLFSPKGIAARDAGGAVFLAAVALCEALRDRTGRDVRIKWPNDLVLGTKKICGMLAECGFAGDTCDWIALGAGLNLRKHALPAELIYAGSLEELTGSAPTVAEVLDGYLPRFDTLLSLWEEHGLTPVLDRMRPLCATLGRETRVNGEYAGIARDIAPDGALMIEDKNGKTRTVYAGDVSVRGLTDYI